MKIDPIPVREERERLQALAEVISKGIGASEALIWFSEYGGLSEVLTVSARLVASSTPGSQQAGFYVSAAARKFACLILTEAVVSAQRDFEAAERARKVKRVGEQ